MITPTRRRTVRKRIVLTVVASAALAACGKEATPIAFDTAAPESTVDTTTPPTVPRVTQPTPPTLPGDAIGDAWEDATGNLAGLPSECGNLQSMSARPDRSGIIAGVSLQGLWSSEDGGATWSQLGQGAGSDEIT